MVEGRNDPEIQVDASWWVQEDGRFIRTPNEGLEYSHL